MVDNEDFYSRRISPLVGQIHRLCARNNIPVVMVFEDAPGRFVTTGFVPPEASGLMHDLAAEVAPEAGGGGDGA